MKTKSLRLGSYWALMLLISVVVYHFAAPMMGERPIWLKAGFAVLVGAYLAYQPIRLAKIARRAKHR